MLKGYHLIYFGPEPWEGLWRNRHHLMSRFAQQNKVLYVEPKIYFQAMRREWGQGKLSLRGELRRPWVTRAMDNLCIYHPPAFVPIASRFPLDRITWLLWITVLKVTMQRLGFDEPIIWLSRPSMVRLVGHFHERLVIYHVVDEYLAYGGGLDAASRVRQQAMERQLLSKADLVIVVSENLLEAKRALNANTYLVPNGVDYQVYARVMDGDTPPPADIARLPRPVIGYTGLISGRLDFELLQHLATSHPEWSIALVGATDPHHDAYGLHQLEQMKNVYFLGRKEIEQVPHYVKAFQVCIIPYAVNERARNASPLKLYDYLASGRPIVTTDFPAANQFGDVIRMARSNEEFVRCVEESLHDDMDSDLCQRRRRVAAGNTWEDRVEQLSCLIQSYLEKD